jgi:hypothetical protein
MNFVLRRLDLEIFDRKMSSLVSGGQLKVSGELEGWKGGAHLSDVKNTGNGDWLQWSGNRMKMDLHFYTLMCLKI